MLDSSEGEQDKDQFWKRQNLISELHNSGKPGRSIRSFRGRPRL